MNKQILNPYRRWNVEVGTFSNTSSMWNAFYMQQRKVIADSSFQGVEEWIIPFVIDF